ncbi:MAG: DUF1013 domain-containing protein [Holosporales bacterium]|jgi:hypothetical protein|nr:DUF1013 domain-containing protein [Holosporales bacterium]
MGPLMPRATAIWLVDNTGLTFDQIAQFCDLHILEVQAIADNEVHVGMKGIDPVAAGQLTLEEIERCTKDPNAQLQRTVVPSVGKKKTRRKYIPLARRQERPNAILWLIKYHPELSDAQICTLLSTTRPTVKALREGTYARLQELTPKSPVQLAFCSQDELEVAVLKAHQTASL